MSDAASTNQLGLSSELLRWLRLLVLPLWARVVIFGLMIVVVVGGLTMLAYGLWAQKDDMASRAMQLITLSLPVLVVVLALVFGQLLAVQLAEALARTGTDELWEFGAGTGALALQVLQALQALGVPVRRYTIVDLSGTLRARQQETLAEFAGLVHWADALPEQFSGVVLGNEVLDAMPVQLLQRTQGRWHERGVVADGAGFAWQDRLTELRPPLEIDGEHDYLTEIHLQGDAFVRTLGERLQRGAAFFIDYGFGESEYYHPQRHMGTLVCHHLHQVDSDPLDKVGLKDITAHVNFTGTAVAAQDIGFDVLGYTTQAHFLINCGLQQKLEQLTLAQRAPALKLMLEHEMGELFKVIGLVKGVEAWEARGFSQGDRTHRL